MHVPCLHSSKDNKEVKNIFYNYDYSNNILAFVRRVGAKKMSLFSKVSFVAKNNKTCRSTKIGITLIGFHFHFKN